MRVGYGYNRIEKEFAHANCDRVWIDGQHTDRAERRAMLSFGLRSGDTLVLLARGDLGHGGELTIIHRALSDRGIPMEVSAAQGAAKKPQGRPRKFDPTADDAATLLDLWRDPVLYTVAYVVKRAADLGYTVDRNALNYRFGKRTDGDK